MRPARRPFSKPCPRPADPSLHAGGTASHRRRARRCRRDGGVTPATALRLAVRMTSTFFTLTVSSRDGLPVYREGYVGPREGHVGFTQRLPARDPSWWFKNGTAGGISHQEVGDVVCREVSAPDGGTPRSMKL